MATKTLQKGTKKLVRGLVIDGHDNLRFRGVVGSKAKVFISVFVFF